MAESQSQDEWTTSEMDPTQREDKSTVRGRHRKQETGNRSLTGHIYRERQGGRSEVLYQTQKGANKI